MRSKSNFPNKELILFSDQTLKIISKLPTLFPVIINDLKEKQLKTFLFIKSKNKVAI